MSQPSPSPAADSPERLRAKEIHHRVMMIMGGFTVFIGLWAAYLSMTAGDLPSIMYGRLSSAEPVKAAFRRARPGLVAWGSWGPEILSRAKKSDRLILLYIPGAASRAARLMDEGAYADVRVAAWITRAAIAVRVDPDERPDLARRYAGRRPMTALLIPSGEILSAASAMSPERFLSWAETLERSFRGRRGDVAEAASAARDARLAAWRARGSLAPAAAPPRRARPPARTASADPVWGGVFRQNERAKFLIDQAGSLDAATLAYLRAHLSDPRGGYFFAQDGEVVRHDGMIVEGDYYFSLPDAGRRALGLPAVDERIFAAPNARMIGAILAAEPPLPETERAFALKTLERYWKEGVKGGLVAHRLGGGVSGFLEDQIALARALLTAKKADRAAALLLAAERTLSDGEAPALFDGPPLAELPEGLSRLLPVDLNAELLGLYQEAAGAHFAERAAALYPWVAARSGELEPAFWALLAARQSAVMPK